MHDRRIQGEPKTFGNAGGLYMRAMTWWDHETQSIWSQPLGEAVDGPLKGTRLELLPSQVTTWESWVKSYPQTFVMVNDLDRVAFRQGFDEDFVIGVVVGELARAYDYRLVERDGVVNDVLGDLPLVVWAREGEFRAYSRRVGERVLTFVWEEGVLRDKETGSTWDVRIGLAVTGPLQGEALQSLPSLTAYDWAWEDFYPEAGFYED